MDDPALQSRRVRSALGLPILHQGQLRGLVERNTMRYYLAIDDSTKARAAARAWAWRWGRYAQIRRQSSSDRPFERREIRFFPCS